MLQQAMTSQFYTFLENVDHLSLFQLSFRLGFITQVLLTMLAKGLFSGKDIERSSMLTFLDVLTTLIPSAMMSWLSGATYRSQNSLAVSLYKTASQLKEQVHRCTPGFFYITQDPSDISNMEFIWPVCFWLCFAVILLEQQWLGLTDALMFCIGLMQYAFKYDSEIASVVQFSSEVITQSSF